MISMGISILAGLAAGLGLFFTDTAGWGWSLFFALLAFGAGQFAFGFSFRRKVKADMDNVQAILIAGQKAIEAKSARWQFRPPSSFAAARAEIDRDQRKYVLEAIKATDALEKYRNWVPLMGRQIATARLQLYWMIKEYDKCDELMEKALFTDPTMYAMKLARMQMLRRPLADMAKVYAKGVRRLAYNKNVLIAATWSWIQLKQGETDAAFRTLTEALKHSDNEQLKANHAALANNRPAHFTNSGIGDTWYSLGLEEPKIHQPRQRMKWR